jgi:hypothetical protein
MSKLWIVTHGAAVALTAVALGFVYLPVVGNFSFARTCPCNTNALNCSDFIAQPEAQACYNYCVRVGKGDIHVLDGPDQDRIVCENVLPPGFRIVRR